MNNSYSTSNRFAGMSNTVGAALVATILLFSGSTAVHADDAPAAAEKAERCIPIRSIKQTKVLDDQSVIFYTNGNKNYVNRLPYSCGGLRMADSFMYRTSQSELCSVDIITVLNRMGSNFAPGPSCGLGMFEEVDKEQLEALTKKPAKTP